ncbi:MAG: AAA family ATPase [Lachnospiraceae bacterium]|nr:AAA family ATPase [Lachnospiraceae bacterium]
MGRADLVGRYVGETAQKVAGVFYEAEGAVLFIDEAYSLVDDREGSYWDEAITKKKITTIGFAA